MPRATVHHFYGRGRREPVLFRRYGRWRQGERRRARQPLLRRRGGWLGQPLYRGGRPDPQSDDGRAISTVAGGGSSVGDYVQATQADLSPTAIAVDTASNSSSPIRCFGTSRVRKVDSKGIISTVAGGAQCCALGDGSRPSPPTSPYRGLAVDVSGNLYIAQADDSGHNLIRKVTTDGTITTVAGGEQPPAMAAQRPAPACPARSAWPSIRPETSTSPKPARTASARSSRAAHPTVAPIDSPWHVAVDASGNLYVTQHADATVRAITAAGAIAAIAGTGAHGFWATADRQQAPNSIIQPVSPSARRARSMLPTPPPVSRASGC